MPQTQSVLGCAEDIVSRHTLHHFAPFLAGCRSDCRTWSCNSRGVPKWKPRQQLWQRQTVENEAIFVLCILVLWCLNGKITNWWKNHKDIEHSFPLFAWLVLWITIQIKGPACGQGEAREISISGYNVDFIQSICASKRVMYCKALIFRVRLIFAEFRD